MRTAISRRATHTYSSPAAFGYAFHDITMTPRASPCSAPCMKMTRKFLRQLPGSLSYCEAQHTDMPPCHFMPPGAASALAKPGHDKRRSRAIRYQVRLFSQSLRAFERVERPFRPHSDNTIRCCHSPSLPRVAREGCRRRLDALKNRCVARQARDDARF